MVLCLPCPAAVLVALACTFCSTATFADQGRKSDREPAVRSIDRGRYLVRIAGCNDCHTAGYPESGGTVPEKEWLTGNPVGFRGPWGTTYPANLRLALAGLSETEWVRIAHTTQFRPPMPWFALRDMSAADLRDIHRFIRYLGPAGSAAPGFVGPGEKPNGPVIQFPG